MRRFTNWFDSSSDIPQKAVVVVVVVVVAVVAKIRTAAPK